MSGQLFVWFLDSICIFADFLMDDAAALVAIVGGGEVTPIHLIIYEEKRVFDSRALLPVNTLACTGVSRFFTSRSLAHWLTRALLKRCSRTGMPCLYVSSFDYIYFFAIDSRYITYINNKCLFAAVSLTMLGKTT